MHAGIGFVLEVTTSILAGLHCIEVLVSWKKGQILFLGTSEQTLEPVSMSDSGSWIAPHSARRAMIEARPNHCAEDSYDTPRPELSEKRPNQEARRPVYSSYDPEESNFIGTPVAEPTKIIRKAPLQHCDE